MRAKILKIILILLISSISILSSESKLKKYWRENIQSKPYPAILDNHEYVEMIFYSGQPKLKIPLRTVCIADILSVKHMMALQESISFADIVKEAEIQLTRKVIPRERESLKSVLEKAKKRFRKAHHKGIHFGKYGTFGLNYVMQFSRTIENAKNIREAVKAISEVHGYTCDLYQNHKVVKEHIKEAIDRGLPVLLELPGKKYRVCFAYTENGNIFKLFVNNPAETLIHKRGIQPTKRDSESLSPFVIRSFRSSRDRKHKVTADFVLENKSPLMNFGSELINIDDLKNVTVYIFMNVERSAAAYKNDIIKALHLHVEEKKDEVKDFPSAKDNKQLWDYYIKNKKESIGGNFSLVSGIVIPAENDKASQHTCLVSSIFSQNGIKVSEFSFSLGKVYRASCDYLNEKYLIPTKEAKAKMQELVDKVKVKYDEIQKPVEEKIKSTNDKYLAAGLRIRETIKTTTSLSKSLYQLERIHGWKAMYETAPTAPFEEYLEAAHKRVPVILKSNKGNKWLLCLGFIKHNQNPMLILVDPTKVDKEKALHINPESNYPGEAVYFEKFNKTKYTPYFIHNWKMSVAAYGDEIKEIFKDDKSLKGKK